MNTINKTYDNVDLYYLIDKTENKKQYIGSAECAEIKKNTLPIRYGENGYSEIVFCEVIVRNMNYNEYYSLIQSGEFELYIVKNDEVVFKMKHMKVVNENGKREDILTCDLIRIKSNK